MNTNVNYAAPWHRASYDRFVNITLPQLLAERLPLGGYAVEPVMNPVTNDEARATNREPGAGAHYCRITVTLSADTGDVTAIYDVPQPGTDGIFVLDNGPIIVTPIASRDELDLAEIACVGEQLTAYCAAQLGEGRANLPWDEMLLRAWLPLDGWVQDLLAQQGQALDRTNWLAERSQLRRICLPARKKVFTSGHYGRTCPIETPEGPNIGKYLAVALGATIENGKLIIMDHRPEAGLGLSAAMVPCLEHSEPARLLMGTNMMRQWLTPPYPEPALVQTGNEPDAPEFHCGRNLLTAFVSWGGDTFEDALLVSASAAGRLNYPRPLEAGDKLSNRHGIKGVVSRIVSDDEMPHLSDNTPVDIVFHFTGLVSRLNFGQVREAVLGRIAQKEDKPALAPPFAAPTEADLRARLEAAGLPSDGMETLTRGRGGSALDRASLVGPLYWGKLTHTSREKLAAYTGPGGERLTLSDYLSSRDMQVHPRSQRQGELEYVMLRDLGCMATIQEQFNTRSAERSDADTLAERVSSGPLPQAGAPSPRFADLQRRLAAGGIRADINETGLAFRLAPPQGERLDLAHPVVHPYLREQQMTQIGALPELPEYAHLAETNGRATRLLAGPSLPASLRQKAISDLEAAVTAYIDALLTPEQLRFDGRVLFSGRAVVAPGTGLRPDQAALPEEMAWTLFGPLVIRELNGDADAVRARDERASQALEAVMARSWVILNRAPTTCTTNLLAFHPVRDSGCVVRLHPAVCNWLDADFDGDQIAVFLPLTEAGQREAGDRLSVAGHLTHDPSLFRGLLSWHEALLGLASLTLRQEGRSEFARLAGLAASPLHFVTRGILMEVMEAILQRQGVSGFLDTLERLLQRGLECALQSGMSMGPFLKPERPVPAAPQDENPAAWQRYKEEVEEMLVSGMDFTDDAMGPLLLSVVGGARGGAVHLSWLLGVPGFLTDVEGNRVFVHHNLRDGLTAEEFKVACYGSRERQAQAMEEWERMGQATAGSIGASGPYAMARAMRASHPGIVFARAAAQNEVDPLTELNTRLFIGL